MVQGHISIYQAEMGLDPGHIREIEVQTNDDRSGPPDKAKVLF